MATPTTYKPIPHAAARKNSVGEVLLVNARYEEALPILLADFDRDPSNWRILVNISICCRNLGHYQSAMNSLARALMMEPNSAVAWHNMTVTLTDMGEFDAALQASDNALKLAPMIEEMQVSRSCALLREGRWREGWPLYDTGRGAWARTFMSIPEWDGRADLQGKRIVAMPDGGIGDSFLWMRYFATLKSLGAYVTFVCWTGQRRLLEGHPWIDDLLEAGDSYQTTLTIDEDHYDYFTSVMALPTLLAESPSQVMIPPTHHFPERTLARMGDLKVGICWSAGETALTRKFRSYLPSQISALADVPHVHWQSLQKGDNVDWARPLPDGDWLDTANIIRNLDLVVSVDTSVAHLAAAMNKDVWLLLPAGSDWKWLRDRDTSCWWPTMRLWRSGEMDDFLRLPERIARELR